MKINQIVALLMVGFFWTAILQASPTKSSTEFLVATKKITLLNQPGHFDFMEIDGSHDRLLVAHTGTKSLVVIDLKKNLLLAKLQVGEVQGIAIDPINSQYILGCATEHKIVFVDSNTLKKTSEIKLTGPVDALSFDKKNNLVYAGEDDGKNIWVINARYKKLQKILPIPGVPEYVLFDSKTNRVFQNIKDQNLLTVIDPDKNKIENSFSTKPIVSPHGLAIDSDRGLLFIGGRNGRLGVFDIKSKTIIADLKIAEGTDQISFDSSDKIVYCASHGYISAIQEVTNGFNVLPDTKIPTGAHTLASDSSRHEVWISYSDKKNAYIQKYVKSLH